MFIGNNSNADPERSFTLAYAQYEHLHPWRRLERWWKNRAWSKLLRDSASLMAKEHRRGFGDGYWQALVDLEVHPKHRSLRHAQAMNRYKAPSE